MLKKRAFAAHKRQLAAWLLLLAVLALAYSGWRQSQNQKLPAASRSVSVVPKKEKAVESESKKKAEVITTMLNFRVRPELKDETVVATLKKGTVVEVIAEQGSWLKVRLADGRVGFIVSQPNLVRIF